MTVLRRGCRSHRPVLLALAEHGERGRATPAALEHLAVCAACEREVVVAALTVAALRRAGAAYRRMPEPPPRTFVVTAQQRPQHWAWRFQLGSLAAGAALVAVVVLPHVGRPPGPPDEALVDTAARAQVQLVNPWQAAERRLASSPDSAPVGAVATSPGTLPPRYPDTMLRPWKEVPDHDASARVFEPR